jgi:peptide deformylase
MTVRTILKMGNPVLREIATPVLDAKSPEIGELVGDMRESLANVGGVGLAAPQIGVGKRLVIFEVPGDRILGEDKGSGDPDDVGIPSTVLINPVIEPLSMETELGWEGCLSVPGLRGLVPRYTHIRYQGLDINGNRIDVEAKGFHARVVQHECDHLDGILYPERMTDLRFLVYESEMSAYMESLREAADQGREEEPAE